MIVAIDAGHGGVDPIKCEIVTPGKRAEAVASRGLGITNPGIGAFPLFVEGVWNREVAKILEVELTKAGIGCVPVYDRWRDTSITRRAELANLAKADLLVSIHGNAGGGEGFECYHNGNGASLASQAGNRIAEAYAMFDLGPLRQPPVRGNFRNFLILRKAKIPALLLEGAFFDNPKDQAKMISREWVEYYTRAIVIGIVGTFGN